MQTRVWWESEDHDTVRAIELLGGDAQVVQAVESVLPRGNVKLKFLTAGVSGAKAFLAYPARIEGGINVPQVVGLLKVGPAAQLIDEADRYATWVRDILANPASFPALAVPQVWPNDDHLAALLYRRVGDTPLGNRLQSLNVIGDIAGAIELVRRLLGALSDWEELSRPDLTTALTATGIYSFAVDPFADFERVCRDLNRSVPNPAQEIDLSNIDQIRRIWDPGALEPQRLVISATHGDLHTENVLVSDDDSIALIDFGAAGLGHFLRDVATLESHVVLRALAPAGQDVSESAASYVEEVAYLYSRTASFTPSSDDADDSSFVRRVIMQLRLHAWHGLMRQNEEYIPQYILALLRHAVRIATRDDSALTSSQRWVAAQNACRLSNLVEIRSGQLRLSTRAAGLRSRPDSTREPSNPRSSLLPLDMPGSYMCDANLWSHVAGRILSARRVDIAGIAPMALISALQASWPDLATEPTVLSIRYVTRPQSHVYDETRSLDGHYQWQVWAAALTGLRNLVRMLPKSGDQMHGVNAFARSSKEVTENCLIRVVDLSGNCEFFALAPVSRPSPNDTRYILSNLHDADGEFGDWLSGVMAVAQPLIMREVDCRCPQGHAITASDNFVAPSILGLSPSGDSKVGEECLKPISLIIMRASGRAGATVLLRMRSPLTDNDDFGKLSLFSARVLEDDLAAGLQLTPSLLADPEAALDAMWTEAGCPDPFTVPLRAFIRAAQSEVFIRTRLDLAAERFDFRGTHIISREDRLLKLGFTVLVVDLNREEVRSALEFNAHHLREVPVAALYSQNLPLNRFLRRKQEWLLDKCLTG